MLLKSYCRFKCKRRRLTAMFVGCIITFHLFSFLNIFNRSRYEREIEIGISNNDRIFFHETSGRTELSFRQTCAVESAALHNPNRPVQVFIQPEPNANINSSSVWRQVLNNYSNVRVIVIGDVGLYFKDSPVEQWYVKGEWRTSEYRVQHMSDFIRIVSLKKDGGMYLDLDIITLKPYEGSRFRNFVTSKNSQLYRLVNGVMHFDRGHRFIDQILQVQAHEYDASDYTFCGPEAMTTVMSNVCNFTRGDWTSNSCTDVYLLPHYYFFPIKDQTGYIYFFPYKAKRVLNFVKQMKEISYGAHLHNFVTGSLSIDTRSNSTQVYALMAAEHCPVSFANSQQFLSI